MSPRLKKYFLGVITFVGERVGLDYKVSMQKKPIHSEDEEGGAWAEDQKERDYYYDDSHGYEEYDPEKDGEESDTEKGDDESRRTGFPACSS